MAAKKSFARIAGFEWDWKALAEPATYKEEARRGYKLGIPGVGRMGVACPHCYLPIAADLSTRKRNGISHCKCPDRSSDATEIMTALGLEMYETAYSNKVQAV